MKFNLIFPVEYFTSISYNPSLSSFHNKYVFKSLVNSLCTLKQQHKQN